MADPDSLSRLIALIKQNCPATTIISDPGGTEPYGRDASVDRGKADLVLIPSIVGEVVPLVRLCRDAGFPIIPRGAGTGLSGGAVPEQGGVVLSTERLTDLAIYPENELAICGSGAITKSLIDEAARHGLTYPPDPASFRESTLGGNVAEGAGGLRCKRYGVTEDYVLGIEGIDSEGHLVHTGHFAQYQHFNVQDLLIASEGTLVIFTRLALRLIPLPSNGTTLLASFDSPPHAASAIADLNKSGLPLTVMEFLDGDAASCSNEYERTDGLEHAAAILLLEASETANSTDLELIRSILASHGVRLLREERDPKRVDELWRVRRNLSKAVTSLAAVRVSEDVAVPNSRFADLVSFVSARNSQSPLRMNAFGHAGDGNLHVNYLLREDTPELRNALEQEIELLLKQTISFGGTLTGEHGIGIAKRAYLHLEFDSPTRLAMAKIKEIFDPAHALNPGKILP